MRRQTMVMALGLVLGGYASADAQAARVEYRDGRIGVAVAIGDLPVRVHAGPSYREVRWVETAWRSERDRDDRWDRDRDRDRDRARDRGQHRGWRRDVLYKQDLRWLVGKETVKTMERHARTLRLRGPLEGRWYRAGRYGAVLEVTADGGPVAELIDFDGDGDVDRFRLADLSRGRW